MVMRWSRPCFSSIFPATVCLLARALPGGRQHRSLPPNQRPTSLAEFHPAIARSWITAASNKLLQPQHVLPTCRKLAWWRCPSCSHEYHKRIDLHVAAGGLCPNCKHMPTLQRRSVGAANEALETILPLVKHRCRPDNALPELAAPNANRVKSSIADDGYLRVVETRNLQPMLARNYEKEVKKIAEDDLLFVSPKLDGVRCVVAWNAKERRPCFFSRSGTLFECCDRFIEPALQPLFEKDPKLVLDGELYNHDIDDFEQLVSAIRTTRERRTPAVEHLQAQLKYHVFDIMYASKFPDMSSVPFSQRYKHLRSLVSTLSSPQGQQQNRAIVLVPAMRTKKADIESMLQRSLTDGYEGIIVRRDGCVGSSANSKRNTNSSAGASGLSGGSASGRNSGSKKNGGAVVGYSYGARSPNLLKFKIMQDDEYVIVSGVEGRGKWKGRLGAFVCRTKSGHHFTVSPATTEENKKNMWQRMDEYRGKLLTVQYQELSANCVPRFPIGKCVRGAKNGKDWI